MEVNKSGRELEGHWKEWGSIEVAFDGFVSHLPWRECDKVTCLTPENIIVNNLCHATHRRNAEEIVSGQNFIFKSYPRNGKCGDVEDGRPVGYSYKCLNLGDDDVPTRTTRYQYVSPDDNLLPKGYYSWWGIKEDLQESRYGGHMFTTNFSCILEQFRQAHATKSTTEPPGLFFKKAGTLRYKKEICYVLLVCADTDDLSQVEHLPAVTEEGGHVTHNGLLDKNGKVVKPDANLMFKKQRYYDDAWEQLVFGFYFSRDNTSFKLPMHQVMYDPKYYHPFCIRTFKVKSEFRPLEYKPNGVEKTWFCPDHPKLPKDKSIQELTVQQQWDDGFLDF